MNILSNNTKEEKTLKSIYCFMKEYSVGKHLKKVNAYKNKGIPVMSIFIYLIQLVFTKKSMYMNILNGTHNGGFSKDSVYRLLNSPFINWSAFLLNIAICVINGKISTLTSKERINTLIVDDTLYSRSRSKNVELLAKVYDHSAKATNKYRKGFQQLTMAWSDGVTLIPIMFRHMSSEEKRNRYNEINSKIDKRSCGYKARKQALSSKPKVMIDMLIQASKAGILAQHVLFDCWFSFPSTIIEVCKLKMNVVARVKNTPKIKYLLDSEKKTLSQIYTSAKKRRGKSKYLLSIAIKLYNKDNETYDARIVYIRDRNNKKNWIALISTDPNLSEEEIIKLYSRRWDIEVFFKICKSYLNLAKEFRGLSYDAIIAHTTVVMTRYIILAVEKRQVEDPRTLGEIFYLCYDEIAEIQFSEAFGFILSLLRDVLEEVLFLTVEQVNLLIDVFISKLPEHFKEKMLPNESIVI